MALITPSGQPGDNQSNDFLGASVPNGIGYKFEELDPASNIYVQRDDQLVVQVISFTSSEVLNVNVRLLQPGRTMGRTQPDQSTVDNALGDSPNGVIVPINVMVATTGILTTVTKVIQLAEGYLLSAGVNATFATQRGQTFVRMFILRGSSNVANVAYLLCADYVTTTCPTGWPFGDVSSPLDGSGILFESTPSNPAAGADFGIALANPIRAQIRSVSATLTTSAVAGNRVVTAQLVSQQTSKANGVFPANVAIPASTVSRVTFAPGAGGSAASLLFVNVQLPQPTVISGITGNIQTFTVVTNGLLAGDQWSNIDALFEEYYDV